MTIVRAATRHEVQPARRSSDRPFFGAMSVGIAASVFVGFARTYYLRSQFLSTPLPLLLHVHGLVFTSWIVLFVTQTALVAGHRVDIHRRLGLAGSVLAAVLVIVGVTTAIVAARRNFAAGNEGALIFLPTPLTDMLVFCLLAVAGIKYRRRSDVHKRLMLLATISILGAAIARWPLAIMARGPFGFFAVTDLFVAAVVVYDLATRRRGHPATLWGGLLIVASQPIRLAIAHTSVWLAIARGLVA